MDRILGTFFSLLTLVIAIAMTIMLVVNFSLTWLWWGSLVLSFVWTIGLGTWIWRGFRKIEIGWEGQLLYLAGRQDYFFPEGWRWAPFPFDIKVADCRQTVIELNKLEVITKDNVPVKIEGSIFRKILDLDKYFSVEESGIKEGLDDIWDQTIRTKIRDMKFDDVLESHDLLGTAMLDAIGARASTDWGIEILRVVVAGIMPDAEVIKDLELKKREELQREGQRVQARHQADLVKFFSGTEKLGDEGPTGPGLSPDLAYEASLVHMDKAEKKKLASNTFGLDVATVKALVEAVTGRK